MGAVPNSLPDRRYRWYSVGRRFLAIVSLLELFVPVFRNLFIAVALSLVPAMAAAAEAQVSLEGAWVRALPPTQPNTAAYLTVVNNGSVPIEVLAASAGIAGRVEFHTTREVEGFVRMEQLSKLDVAAGQSLALAPGGTHLMLLELSDMPEAGTSVRLCLTLASGDELCTDAKVRKDAADDSHQHHHH